MARLESIHIIETHGGQPQRRPSATLESGKGLVGDRNHRDSGVDPEDELTLVETEMVEAVCRESGLAIAPEQTRRNLVTRGVRLNELVGQRFRIGETVLLGMELCEPCRTLGKHLQTKEIPSARIIQLFTHRAGLRARILVGGVIHEGDPLETGEGSPGEVAESNIA